MRKLLLVLAMFFALHAATPSYAAELIVHNRANVTQVVPGLPKVPHDLLFSHYRVTAQLSNIIEGKGSGTAIDARHVLTAAHVVSEANFFAVDIFDNDGGLVKSVHAFVKRVNTDFDLAVLETDSDLPFFTPLDYAESFNVGDWGYIIGAPHGTSPFACYWGMLAAKSYANNSSPDVHRLWQLSCDVAPGVSGGGVYSADNKFVGVLTRGQEAISLFVPADIVRVFLADPFKDNPPTADVKPKKIK